MNKATVSSGENVSEIQSLTLRTRDLSHSVDWWNAAMIWGLAFAAVAALFVLVATRVVVAQSKKLSTAQDELNDAKERQLQTDLKNKDVEIGNLKVRAASLDLEAEKLRKELVEQGHRAALLRGTAGRKFVDKLKPFAGQKFDLQYFSPGSPEIGFMDSEASELVLTFMGLLWHEAGWAKPNIVPTGGGGQGVWVYINADASPATRKAATALASALHEVPLAGRGTPIEEKGAGVPEKDVVVLKVAPHQ